MIGGAILGSAREPRQRTDTRPSVWRKSLRVHLEAWSKHDRTTAVWAYPSDPWQVLTGLILDGIGEVGWPNPAEVLDMVPTLEDATSKTMSALEVMANPSRRRAAVQRLRRAAETLRADPEGWDGSAWVKAANLGPIARKWLDLLAFDGGGLAPSSSVLRVTARINHSDVDKRNRMSTGRMELAILVGDDAKAATVNAAMHRLGNRICLIGEPLCTQCPIRQFCRSASS